MQIILFLSLIFFLSVVILTCALRDYHLIITALLASAIIYFVRVIPNRAPTMQWWGDHYYYFWVTRGVVESGSLNLPSEFTALYPQAQRQATWFGLHVVSSFLINITGIDSFEPALRYLAPVLGPLTLILLWLFYNQFFSRGSALAAAYTTAMLDLVVFYQTEFHEQGAGIVAGVFFLAVMIWISKSKEHNRRTHIIAILALFGLSVSHHMTALTIMITYFIFAVISATLNRYYDNSGNVRYSVTFLILLAIINPVFYMWGAENTVQESILSLLALLRLGVLSNSGGVNVKVAAEGYQPTLLTEVVAISSLLVKLSLVLLSGYSVYMVLRERRESNERQLTFLTVGFGLSALLVFPVHRVAIVRMTIFGYVGLVGLSYLTFHRVSSHDVGLLSPGRLKAAMSMTFAIIVTISLLSAYAPSLVDPSTDISPDSYTDIKPMGEQGPTAAGWLQSYSDKDVTHHWTGKLRGVLFYYGEIPLQNLKYTSNNSVDGYGVYDTARIQSSSSVNDIYTNGRITMTKSE